MLENITTFLEKNVKKKITKTAMYLVSTSWLYENLVFKLYIVHSKKHQKILMANVY